MAAPLTSDQAPLTPGQAPPTPTKNSAGRSRRMPSLTLAICLAAGTAAGIGLARPATPGATSADGGGAGYGQSQPLNAEPAAENNGAGYGQTQTDPGAGGGVAAPDQAGTPAAPQTIRIADFDFGTPITVSAGGSIEVGNADGAAHTLTSEDGLFDTGVLNGGTAATLTAPTTPGSYQFFCAIHPSMQGSLTVG